MADRATPEPWEVGEDEREYAATLMAQPRLATTGEPVGKVEHVIIPFGRAYSDARFIALARTAVPALLDALDEAEREREDVRHLYGYKALEAERDSLRAQLAAETKRADDLHVRLDGVCERCQERCDHDWRKEIS